MKYFKIGFAGSGNLAWHLAQDLEKAGHFIPVIFSRNVENATLLAAQLYDTKVLPDLDFSAYDLDLVIIAVSDDALARVASDLVVQQETIVVHTSGSRPMEILSHLEDNYGVFYPLQTFTKTRAVDFSEIPICIESSNSQVHDVLFTVGRSLSRKVEVMSSESRLTLHTAAVFANNFTNHMLFWAKTLTDSEGIDFQLLKTLSLETVEKAFAIMPELGQTGPARRGDQQTMQIHLDLLADNPELSRLYKLLSQSIALNT